MKPSEEVKQALADPSGERKDRLITEFAEQAERIWDALNQGVSEQEYERLTKMARAIETAVDIVETLSKRASVH